MRKALSRDVSKASVVPLKHPVRPEDVDWTFMKLCDFIDVLINKIKLI